MFTAGAAASSAENRKITKYADLEHLNIFIPVGIEKMGVWGLGATKLVSALGRRLAIYRFLGSQVYLFPKTAYRHCYPERQCIVRSWNNFIGDGITFRSHADRIALVSSAPHPLVIFTPSPACFFFCFVRLYYLAYTFFAPVGNVF